MGWDGDSTFSPGVAGAALDTLHPLFTCTDPQVRLCAVNVNSIPNLHNGISKAPAVPISFSDWREIEGETFAAIPLCWAGVHRAEGRSSHLLWTLRSKHKSCSGSSPNIQVGFTSTKGFASLSCREELWGEIGHRWDC